MLFFFPQNLILFKEEDAFEIGRFTHTPKQSLLTAKCSPGTAADY
jgi:hypothetical protein